jgi:uncharacterized protein involved in exopolysaccharide biosynthesis
LPCGVFERSDASHFTIWDYLVSETIETLTELNSQPTNESGNGFRPYAPAQLGISAMLVIELLWRERRFLARSTIFALAAFTILAFLLPNHYTAITRLMPPDYGGNSSLAMLPALGDQASSGGGIGIMGMASRLLGMNTSGDLLIGVIQSQSVEDRVIAKLGLMKIYGDKYIEDGRKDLESHTALATDAKTGIITISVTDHKPALASQIANAYVAELNQALSEVNTSSAHRERVFLEQRLQQVQQQSEADSKEFALFSSQNAAVDIPEQAKSMVAAGAELQSQLIVAEAEVKGLQQIYSENNARVRSAKARVEELQKQVNRFGGKNVNPATDSSLGQDQLYPSVRQLPLLGVKYLDLYRRSKVDDAVFELLTKEYEIAKIQEARAVPTAQVLDPALVPSKKSSPHRLLIMIGGILAGFVLGCTYLTGRFLWQGTADEDPLKLFLQDVLSTTTTWVGQVPVIGKLGRRLRQAA